jgi:hypothetical protein
MWRTRKQYKNFKISIKAIDGGRFTYAVKDTDIKGSADNSNYAYCFAVDDIEEFINKK